MQHVKWSFVLKCRYGPKTQLSSAFTAEPQLTNNLFEGITGYMVHKDESGHGARRRLQQTQQSNGKKQSDQRDGVIQING